MQKTEILELGYFLDESADDTTKNYQGLVRTIEDGIILPSLWETPRDSDDVDALFASAAMMDIAHYVSFVEIPEDDTALQAGSGYGLGFTRAFLEKQGVDAVEYIAVQEDWPWRNPYQMLQNRLTEWLESEEDFGGLEEQVKTALATLRSDPVKQAIVRERIAEYANYNRTYYEVLRPDEAIDGEAPKEWRSTTPVQFTLSDIQTVYVRDIEEVSHFRLMYPEYQGTFVVLG